MSRFLKRFFMLFLFLFLAAMLPFFSAAASSFTSSCPRSFRLEGTVNYGGTAFTAKAGGPAEETSLEGDTVIEVTGKQGKNYRTELNGQEGTVPQNDLTLSGSPAEPDLPEALCDTLILNELLPKQGDWTGVTFSGELRSPDPMDLIALFLWDERSLSLEQVYTIQPENPTATADADLFNDLLYAERMRGGRKTLVIQGYTDEGPVVLARVFFIVRGNEVEPAHITDQCELSVSEPLLDSSLNTVWQPEEGMPSLTVRIAEETEARLLTLEWQVPPDSFTVTLLDREGQVLSETTCETGFYLDSVELDENVSEICITPAGESCALSTVRVYPEQYAEFAVQRWEPLPEKVDLMLFSAHQDDEILFFGGMIPYYSAVGKTVAVAYMADCGRTRYAEALDGLWTAGLKYHPIFLGWRDGRFYDDEILMNLWTYYVPDRVHILVRLIRKYCPDVVVTHDFRGEYGNWQHRETAMLVAEAAVLAGDPTYDTEDGQEPWEVKKVYIHLYEENQILMDWDRPLEGETVLTPHVLEMEAYDKHRSQRVYGQMEDYGVLYNNRCFGLYYTTVGEDKEKNDLFENISPD